MNIAINTDYLTSHGSPEKYIHYISEAGFTHLHWCHQWNTDFIYSKSEIAQYKKWLKTYNIKLLDIHGTAGMEKSWFSLEEYQRKAGVELVLNRGRMLKELDGEGSLMMHTPYLQEIEENPQLKYAKHDAFKKSLDEMLPILEKENIPIAIENLPKDNYQLLEKTLNEYNTPLIGITYDSGHGNMGSSIGLDFIERNKDRLLALHLHDNNQTADQHQSPFYGTINWTRLAQIIATSSYAKTNFPLSFELAMRNTPFYKEEFQVDQPENDIKLFLQDAYTRCKKVVNLYKSFLK